MNPRLHSDITRQLDRDFAFKQSSGWLRGGECPSCKKKELYASADAPWVLRCGRLNKCGVEYHIKELYPDLFTNWSERHPATPEDPNAAADAYMRDGRGFDLARVRGSYAQESYYDHEKKIGSATVRFMLPNGSFWERIIDRPQRFDRKANFKGSYGGIWWVAPGLDLAAESVKEIWITEGIFDSYALLHHDIASATPMTCNVYPDISLKELADKCAALGRQRPRLVWALDTGKAGTRFTKQWVERSKEEGWDAVAAVPPEDKGGVKLDWNELHQRDRLNQKTLDEARYQGALLLAKSAHDKALLMYNHDGYNSFYFGYDSRMYWFEVDLAKFAKAKDEIEKITDGELSKDELRNKAMLEAHTLREIADCYFTALYFQKRLLTDESWYYFRVDFPHDGPSIKDTFTGKQTTSAGEFKTRLRSAAAGATFFGNNAQLDRIMSRQLFNIKTVQTIDFVGYSKEKDHSAWVFNSVAVKDGKMIFLNEEDYFELGRTSIKSLNAFELAINTNLQEFSTEWFDLLWHCYRYKGLAALAYWLGSLFAEQIRARYGEFPFMELVGEANAGKSTLIEFLWMLCGRYDYEGFDPRKGTIVGRSRNFMQVSNLPVVLIEGDRHEENKAKQTGFDWEELKPLFNGRGFYTRGVKNGGTDTHEPPFRGALVISQNSPVQSHEAIMQRLLHIGFDTSMHTPETEISADKLKQFPMERVSGFILKAALAEKQIMTTLAERIPYHEKRIRNLDGVKNSRIVRNHAKLAALVDALSHVIPVGKTECEETLAFIEDMAVERQETINTDHKVVQEFWETYEFLNGHEETPRLNHARKDDRFIAINLNHYVAVASDLRQQIPDLGELKKLLKTSRARKFIDIKPVNSAINAAWNKGRGPLQQPRPETMKCWVFENPSTKGGRENGTS